MPPINERALQLIKDFEGCKLVGYLDAIGVPTIGWGTTGPEAKVGRKISQGEADEMLLEDVEEFAIGVRKLIGDAKTTDDQFGAMVSLAYNIGLANFAKSTVLKRHKLGNYIGASKAFVLWNRAGGSALRGLTRRREAEAALYLGKR